MALFARATQFHKKMNCKDSEYPIKAVFGGGGSQSVVSHSMLKKFLLQLRKSKILPGEKIFSINSNVFPGPPSRQSYDVQFAEWGKSFGEKEYPRPSKEEAIAHTLDGTLKTLEGQKALMGLKAPVIVALRPLFELVVCIGAKFDSGGLATASGKKLCADVLTSLSQSQVIMYQGGYNFKEMGSFYRKSIDTYQLRRLARLTFSSL